MKTQKLFFGTLFLLFSFLAMPQQLTAQTVEAPTARQLSKLGLKDATCQQVAPGIWSVKVGKKQMGHVVNSTNYAKDVRGFKGTTPVLVYIDKSKKVKKVAALQNVETPNFFSAAEPIVNKWNGVSAKKGTALQPDAVSGATYSSKALIANVQAALKAYNKYVK